MQVCNNGTRVFVHRSLYDTFVSLLVDRVRALRVGNPMHADTKVGASICEQHMNRVLDYVQSARDEVTEGGFRISLHVAS